MTSQLNNPWRSTLRAASVCLRALLLAIFFAAAPAVFADCKDASKEWTQLRTSTDQKRLRAFADRYPDCPEANKARQRLRELEQQEAAPPVEAPSRSRRPSSGSGRPAAPPSPSAADEQLWQTIKDLSEVEAFENYLKQYPQGKHAAEAQQRVQSFSAETDYWNRIENSSEAEIFTFYLKEVAAGKYAGRYKSEAEAKLEAIAQAEESAWNSIQGGQEPGLFERYLKDYPRGKHAADAAEKIKTLREEQLWRRVKESQDPSEVEKYTREYPKGKHAVEAAERIQSLGDDLYWKKIEKSREPADFQKYLELYPKGKNAAAARERASRPPGTTEFFGPIINRRSNKTIDVRDWSKEDKAPVQQWTYARQANQRWEVIQIDPRRVAIVNENSGKVLEASGSNNVRQAVWRGEDQQKWRLESAEAGHYRIVNVKSGLCLGVDDKSKKDGARIEQVECRKAAYQEWRLAR